MRRGLRQFGSTLFTLGREQQSHSSGSGPTDPHFSTVQLLMGFDTALTDESASPVTFSVGAGTPAVSSAQKLFGAKSLRCNGDGYIQTATGGDWQPGSGDWTLELAIAHDSTDVGNARGYMDFGTGLAGIWMSRVAGGGGTWSFDCWTSGNGHLGFQSTTNSALTANVFKALCLERSGSIIRAYVDGTMIAKATGVSGSVTNSGQPLRIGANGNGNHLGYIDEVRINNGFAYYASDAGYTPAVAAFPRS